MSARYDDPYEHIVLLEGSVTLSRVVDGKPGTLLLEFCGKGITRAHGWFSRAEKYVFLATRGALLQLADRLVRDTQRDPSTLPLLDLGAAPSPFSRDRPLKNHRVEQSYTPPSPSGLSAYSGPALILEVVHDDGAQRRSPRPVLESQPYPFLCDHQQVLDLAQDIQSVLG